MRALRVAVIVVVLLVAAGVGYRYFVLLPAAREPVLAQLNDPESARFQNERLVGPWQPSKMFYCGQVNAKNKMGGYVGYSHFFAFRDRATILPVGENPPTPCAEAADKAPWAWLRR
jgi:hypothetical protein